MRGYSVTEILVSHNIIQLSSQPVSDPVQKMVLSISSPKKNQRWEGEMNKYGYSLGMVHGPGALPGRADRDFRSGLGQVRSAGCRVRNLSQGYRGSGKRYVVHRMSMLPSPTG